MLWVGETVGVASRACESTWPNRRLDIMCIIGHMPDVAGSGESGWIRVSVADFASDPTALNCSVCK